MHGHMSPQYKVCSDISQNRSDINSVSLDRIHDQIKVQLTQVKNKRAKKMSDA